jgi:hypothetical protein
MPYSPARLLLVASSVALGACATTPSAAKRASRAILASETTHRDSVVVRVVNQVAKPVTVYQLRGSSRAALGQVNAGAEGRFPMRAADAAGKMTLAATPVGDRMNVESVPFRVERGQVAVFVITPELGGSRVFVDWPASR